MGSPEARLAFGRIMDETPALKAALQRIRSAVPSDAAADGIARLVGVSPAISTLRDFIPKVAARDCNVLITGETGTGKERVAEAIHRSSPRRNGNLVCVNCAAIPDSLFESEFFGYEKGAFSGAVSRYEGRLAQANGGTLFLDEVGDMSLLSQAKILRAIDQRQIFRVGGRKAEDLDIRVIAATNQDLPTMVAQKTFRSDLYYRLNVVNIKLPPLRERREDVALLFDHYMNEWGARDGSPGRLTPDAAAALLRYDWPGNVRELKNTVDVVLLDGLRDVIDVHDLPEPLRSPSAEPLRCERERLIEALVATHWNKSAAAKQLQCSRMTLYRKMTKYDLVRSPMPGSLDPAD